MTVDGCRKTCTGCSASKPLELFYRQHNGVDGRMSRCKECVKEHHRQPHIRARRAEQARVAYHTPEGKERHRRQHYSAQSIAKRAEYKKSERHKELEKRRRNDPDRRPRWLFLLAQRRAKKYGIVFSLTLEDIVVPDVCPVLGIPFDYSGGKLNPASPSLDRLRPELGYVPGNVRVVSFRANRLKSDATLAEVRGLLDYMERALVDAS